jgi:hypothetical protein
MWAPRALAVAFVALTSTVPQVRADTVLDQEYTDGFLGALFTNGSGFRRAKTFTVGVTGTLSEIDIFLDPFSGSPSFTGIIILSTLNGVPTTAVATGSFQSAAGGVAVFTTSLPVTIGEVLAMEPISMSGAWRANGRATYPGGQDYFVNPPFGINSFTPSGGADNFRTFVTLVPGPIIGAGLPRAVVSGTAETPRRDSQSDDADAQPAVRQGASDPRRRRAVEANDRRAES